jgi:hypothetical protein
MPLDLSAISDQVDRMGEAFVSPDREARILDACNRLHAQDPDDLRAKLDAPKFRTSWLVARPVNALSGSYQSPQRPSNFSVVASDGSFIAPDRHNPVRYYVINTGSIRLTYGAEPDAHLNSQGRLFYEEDDLYIPHDYRIIPVEGSLLGFRMAVLELRSLLDAAQASPEAHPLIALRDGSLIVWGLQGEEEEVRDRFLNELVGILGEFQEMEIPLASYVSYPNSRDVVNALRVGMCPDDPVSCDHCTDRVAKREPVCNALGRVIDRWVFDRALPEGYRSDVFSSSAPILEHYGEGNEVDFFYLNVGEEIARVEAPRWVLQEERHLGLLHALIYDQCERGRGYPSALKESHEQAVITAAERRVVEGMVGESLSRHKAHMKRSAKDTQKRERGL